MKKAKLMLATIACLAVVGGAFAFKANNANRISKIFFHTTTPTGFCTVPYTLFYTPTATTTALLIPYSTLATNTTLCSTRVLVSE